MNKRINGFTLIEVMVALTIIAIALASLIKASGNHTHSAGILKNKTLAHYVAINEIVRLKLQPKWPDLGKTHKSSEMAGVEWFWTLEVEKVSDENAPMRGVKVTVYLDDDRKQNITSVQGFVAKPEATE